MTSEKVQIIGSYLSPFVRKVLVVLELKNIPYVVDPLIPFFGNENFEKKSVLRTIPILIDGNNTIVDSSVIIQYLEEKYPNPSILPEKVEQRAKHRMIEEYVDTFGANVLIWGIWNEIINYPFIFKRPTDKKKLQDLKDQQFPLVCYQLEKMLSEIEHDSKMHLGQISIGAFFRNASLAKFHVDGKSFPKLRKIIDLCDANQVFKSREKYEITCLKFPPLKHREKLKELGASLTNDTDYWNEKPMLGPLSKY